MAACFAYQIVLDGNYLIGARAEDRYGVSGPGRDLSITLNRSLPFAPSGVAGGRARGGVDVEWQANRERDIIGYTVYRQVPLGTVQTVCAQITVTSCHDAAPPPDALVDYWVVALDRDSSGAARAGATSEVQHVRAVDLPPTAPPTLSASTSNGTTVLTWTPGVDPDPGDSVDFYRIYRDGAAITDRYDRTGLGTDLTWTDTATGGESHTYYVSAVDTQLGESPLTGPVTQ